MSPAAAPHTTIEVVDPPDARLFYTDGDTWQSALPDADVINSSRTTVSVASCPDAMTGYFGGLLVTGPGCVTLEVRPDGASPSTIHVPATGGRC